AELFHMVRRHLLLDAISAQALDLALHVEPRLIERVAEVGAGIAAHHQAAGLRHEGAHGADAATNHDVDALHGNAASGAAIALAHDQAALTRGSGGGAGIAFHPPFARHDVLGQADAALAIHDDGRFLVHAAAVVADMAVDLDLDRLGQPDGAGMLAVHVDQL